jgi:methionyl-tRNA formyltransferase
MKIAIVGQQDFGKAVLEAFLARKDEVAGVFCAPEKPGARPDALKVAAQEKGVKVFQFASLKGDDAKKALQDLNVDIGIMAFVLQFAPQDFVKIPKHGTIQYHPSLLPLYRGPSSTKARWCCRRKPRSARTTPWARCISTAFSPWG